MQKLIKNIKISVTGASGYIGSHVVTSLVKRGVEVISVDCTGTAGSPPTPSINMDIFSGSQDIFRELGSPDVCLHLAWKDSFSHNSDAHIYSLAKHYEFIENMIRGGCEQVAVMGTMHEIGCHAGAVDENTPCRPINRYGIAKNTLRQAVQLLAQENGVVFQWLRAFYITGDDYHNHSIFSKIIQAEKQGDERFPFNTGKNKYDFIDIVELADMIAAVVLQKDVTGIINCCSGKPVSLAEKVESFIKENRFKIKLDYGAFPERPYDSPEIWGDNSIITALMSKNIRE